LKLPARAEKFRDFGRFPAILLNFQLKIQISADRAETPPTKREKPLKDAFFSRTLAGRPTAEKILSRINISSDSFVLTADKSRIPLPISKFVNEICLAACKWLVRANIWIPGQRFGRPAKEFTERPEKRNNW
jgi:hypothetical protein